MREDKQPTIVVRLDRSALEALFPEGSQARIDLSAGVINNFVQRITDKNAHEVMALHVATLENIVRNQAAEFRKDIEKHAEMATRAYFGPTPAWDHLNRQLSPDAKRRVEDLISASFTVTVQQHIQKALPADKLQAMITEQLGILIGSDITTVESNIKLMIDKAMKEKFK